MDIIFEDAHVIVCHKEAGLATQSGKTFEKDLVSILKKHLATEQKKPNPYLGVVHRLDQPVEGLLVFAKTPEAGKKLSGQLIGGELNKRYKARVYGCPMNEKDTLTDYLMKEGNMAKVTNQENKEAKKAVLSYKRIEGNIEEQESLLEVEIETGRFHQIRAQLSNAGFPILGDLKYGSEESIAYSREKNIKSVKLLADTLEFIHPKTGKKMEFHL